MSFPNVATMVYHASCALVVASCLCVVYAAVHDEAGDRGIVIL